jgi:hypothetical protein
MSLLMIVLCYSTNTTKPVSSELTSKNNLVLPVTPCDRKTKIRNLPKRICGQYNAARSLVQSPAVLFCSAAVLYPTRRWFRAGAMNLTSSAQLPYANTISLTWDKSVRQG